MQALPMGRSMATNESLHWEDVQQLRDLWPRKLIIKGIQHPEDAKLALKYGADAIIVSNHGGRVLDSAPATIDILPEIVHAVKGKMNLLIDGGFRRVQMRYYSDVQHYMALHPAARLAQRLSLNSIGVKLIEYLA